MENFSKPARIASMIKNLFAPQINNPEVIRRLEALREALKLEKGEFSLSFGLDPSSYSKMLSGAKPLKSEYGFAIATLWGVTMDFLYFGDFSKIEESLRNSIMANLNKPQEYTLSTDKPNRRANQKRNLSP